MSECNPDFGKTAEDYARHRAGFPAQLLDRLALMGVLQPGMRVLDLGTGTGSLARLFAQRGCNVTAVDIAPELLQQAKRLDQEAGVEVTYLQAPAERTGLESDAFGLVSAGQCWHWFDRPKAAREVRRLLIDGGSVVIAHFDWIPVQGNVVSATEEILLRYTPSWPYAHGVGLYPRWLADIQGTGFSELQSFSFDINVPYSRESWIGRVRASAPVAGTLDREGVERCSNELEAMLEERFPQSMLQIPHRLWALTARA